MMKWAAQQICHPSCSIRLVSIDCWNTLLRAGDEFDFQVWEVLFHEVSRLNRAVSREQFGKVFQREAGQFERVVVSEHFTPSAGARFRWICNDLRITCPCSASRSVELATAEILLRNPPAPFFGAEELLQTLRNADLRTCLICNTGWSSGMAITEVLRVLGLASLFDLMLFSDQAGMAKPGSGIFTKALDAFSVTPEQAVHLGDDEILDVQGARNAGIHALQFVGSRADSDTRSAGVVSALVDAVNAITTFG